MEKIKTAGPLNWTLDNGTLTISGEGAMPDYEILDPVPWHLDEYPNDSIVTVIIEQGVTHIGNWAFQECVGIVSVAIPDSVSSIGEGTFAGCSSLNPHCSSIPPKR
jgi:hypothetical protein